MDNMDWVDKQEQRREEERSKDYFNITEGTNRFVLLSHCAPLAQVFEGGKYRAAVEGDRNVSIKGVCWVYQEGVIKQAKLPYTVVKEIRGLQQNPDWEFTLPFPHVFTLTAKNAGTKEVEYSLNASPKKVVIPEQIILELKNKPTPDEVVERIKGKVSPLKSEPTNADEAQGYDDNVVTEDINPDDIPF